jgi:3-methylfumaryl-CoA hydratase
MSSDTAIGSIDLNLLRSWIGSVQTSDDQLCPWTASAVAATLRNDGSDWPVGHALPPLWHWCYFLPIPAQNTLGLDGHPVRGDFLPPVPLPRRMWAGSELEFLGALRLGDRARRVSTVQDVSLKHGRSGTLVFVKVEHVISVVDGNQDTPLIREQQNIVYRDAEQSPPAAFKNATTAHAEHASSKSHDLAAQWSENFLPNSTLLFRYSALTFNPHRIHYDYPYATQVEGYSGLIVHGPLIATMLLEAAQRQYPQRSVVRYEFRAVKPLICGSELRISGSSIAADGRISLWAHSDQELKMQASAQLV